MFKTEASLTGSERVVRFMRSGTGHCVVRATAGSGKTTTLVEVAGVLPKSARSVCLAFNRNAVNELQRRLPAHVAASTIHALGRRVLARRLSSLGVPLQLDGAKYRKLLAEESADLAFGSKEDVGQFKSALVDLLEFVRLTLTDAKDGRAVERLFCRYDLVPPPEALRAAVQPVLRATLRRGLEEALANGTVDFTDMVYLPFILKLACEQYDFLLTNEAQDVSKLALEFTLRFVRNGRCMFVGDPRQAIFGFAGADPGALERITSRIGATELLLSVTYRCPTRHVALAQVLAPEISARPGAPAGQVTWLSENELAAHVAPGDLILCRSNAPLLKTCLRLVKSGARAFVVGRGLSKSLKELSDKVFLTKRLRRPEATLAAFRAKEFERLERVLKDHPSKKAMTEVRLELLDCLGYLVAALPKPTKAKLDALVAETFRESDPPGSVTLSTIHRAKGSEADRVYILQPELLPASYARGTEALAGERCVMFVALTRAKRELVFVGDSAQEVPGPWGDILRAARLSA